MPGRFLLVLCCVLISLPACSGKRSGSIRDPIPEWVSRVETQPLDVREVRATSSAGVHVILLQTTRFPDSIAQTVDEHPPRIHLQLGGPDVGGDLPARTLVPPSDVVTAVHISRSGGAVTVTLDLTGEEPPEFTVHEMVDWLMVRIVPE